MKFSYLNVVIDLSHHNENVNFDKVAGGGVVAVIHKSTQGMTGRDHEHDDRRDAAKAAGLLWGSYHFGTSKETGRAQADAFLDKTQPAEGDLLALDWEENLDSNGHSLGDMSLSQARDFVQRVAQQTGQYPMIYGGHMMKEALGSHVDPVLAQCPLWLAHYSKPGHLPTWPATWASWTLWQYTGDGVGDTPNTAAGVGGYVERDCYIGTLDQLKDTWGNNLNHQDIAVTIPHTAPAGVTALPDEKTAGWSAVYHMDLAKSSKLIEGILEVNGPDEKHEFRSTSGQAGHQDFDNLWEKDKGPVPPNPDAIVGNAIETSVYVGTVVKHGYRIRPENVTNPETKVTRGAFRVHFDGGAPGSAGCIAIRVAADYEKFNKLMAKLKKSGVKAIPLTLDYT